MLISNFVDPQQPLTDQPDLDQFFMQKALVQAKLSWQKYNEVPVGAVIVQDGKILAASGNLSITNLDPTAHAEIVAIRAAAKVLQNYRLGKVSLYVTLEPCAMCVGAILQARITRVVFGADDRKFGALKSIVSLTSYPWNHKFTWVGGVLAAEAGCLLKSFFQTKR